jgi:magnesium chelatase family protein
MLAKSIVSILPPLTNSEAIETTQIYSVTGKGLNLHQLIHERPFRQPHHAISDIAMIGGGSYPQPGEISLAHNGVLFLDELPEFKRNVIEVLRQPMEEGVIHISRAKMSLSYPASFMLIAAMNPCPCGFYNHPTKQCICSSTAIQKYLHKISGPLLDRIDLHLELAPVSFAELQSEHNPTTSDEIAKHVKKARAIQNERFAQSPNTSTNAQMDKSLLKIYGTINKDANELLKNAMEKFELSARAHDRIIRVARTIADLEASKMISANHISEAIQYRCLDRSSWGKWKQ